MKKLLYLILLLLVVTGAGLGAASWWVMRQMKPDTWVELAEKNWNCRAQIQDASLSLFTKPATLKLTGVQLAPRDEEVAKPYAERTPLAKDAAPIVIPEITLEVKLDDLMNRRLFMEHLRISEPKVVEVRDAQGKSSLEGLFKKPGSAEAEEANAKTSATQPPVQSGASEKSDPFLAFALHAASLDKGQFEIRDGTTVIRISGLNFNATGIDVDANDLANHNRINATLSAQVDVQGMARIEGTKRPAELVHLLLAGQGEIAPYHPVSREWKPYAKLKLTLAKGSVLGGHQTIGDAAGKDLRKLQEYGVDLGPVRIGGPLLEDAAVIGDFSDDRFVTRVQTRFLFPEYEVSIEPKSWVNAAKDRHEIELRLSCGPELQSRLTKGIAEAKLGDSIARGLTKALSDDKGRLTFDIESGGALSDPKVKPKTDRVLKNLMRGEGLGDLLQGLLKKL